MKKIIVRKENILKNSKMYVIFLLLSIGLTVFSESKGKNEKDLEQSISESFSEEGYENSDEELIFLDRITEEKEKERNDKPNRIIRFINKIDNKVNPVLKFYTPSSYGSWYLIKTTDRSESGYENVKYSFNQEENGYRIVKTYYVPESKMWMEAAERAWIKEEKGKVFLKTERKLFKSYSNEIIFFDSEYRYMIIKYEKDNSIKVFSRFPVERIMLEGEELDKFEKITGNISNLYNVAYNRDNINTSEKSILDSDMQEERAKIIEEHLIENHEDFFKMN